MSKPDSSNIVLSYDSESTGIDARVAADLFHSQGSFSSLNRIENALSDSLTAKCRTSSLEVDRALLSLPSLSAELIRLLFIEGLPASGIATRLDMPLDEIEEQLRAALATLRRGY